MPNNALRFLSAHNNIEEYLSKLVKPKEYLDFIALLNIAINMGHKEVSYYQHDLRQFSRLRNAIAHSYRQDMVIAEPNDRAVMQIEKLVGLIKNPPKVEDILDNKVEWVDAEGSLADALEILVPRYLSQAPIFLGNEFVGLLTTDTISRWLASCVQTISVGELCQTMVGEVYELYTEDKDNHVFLKLDSTIIEALALFQEYDRRESRLEAILFTTSGFPSIDIKFLMNSWDIQRALSCVELGSTGM